MRAALQQYHDFFSPLISFFPTFLSLTSLVLWHECRCVFFAAIISLLLDAPFEFFIRSNLIFEWGDFKEEWHLNRRRTKITHGRKLCHICQKLITDVKNLGKKKEEKRGGGEKIKRGGEKKQLIFGSSDHDSSMCKTHPLTPLFARRSPDVWQCVLIHQPDAVMPSARIRTLLSVQQGQMEVFWIPTVRAGLPKGPFLCYRFAFPLICSGGSAGIPHAGAGLQAAPARCCALLCGSGQGLGQLLPPLCTPG